MKSPATRVKEFITKLMQYYYEEYQNSMKPSLIVAESKPKLSAKAFYVKSQKERDILVAFHNYYSSSVLEDSPCQCTLIS